MDYSHLDCVPDPRTDWLAAEQHVDREINRLKTGLTLVIDDKKINLKPLIAEKKRLANKTFALSEKAREIFNEISINLKQEVETCLQDIRRYTLNLEENQSSLNALQRIITIHSLKAKAMELVERKSFYDSWSAICDAKKLISSSEDLQQLVSFSKICDEVENTRKQIRSIVESTWRECVYFEETRETKETKITIHVDKRKSDDMKTIIQTMLQMEGQDLIDEFLKSVQYKILLSQITSESEISSQLTDDSAKLIIIIDKSSEAPHYLKAFDRITIALDFIYNHINVEIPGKGDLFRVMGHAMAEQVTEKLMESCLSQVILNVPGQTEMLGDIVANAEKLEVTLKRMGFLSNEISLVETDGGDVFFANMIYGLYLEKARKIMKKQSLSVCTLELRLIDDSLDFCSAQDKEFLEKLTPTLCVNSYCKEILDLIDTIVKEINNGKSYYGLRHLYTICNIFEMYCAIVPHYSRKLFETTPSHVAMYHNSCLYFAHVLLFLSADCKNHWPTNLRDKFPRFLDESRELRSLAKNNLKTCVSKKRTEIILTLKESGLSTIQNAPMLDPSTENSVRQSIRLLEGFSMSMKNLPERVYINSMGFLIDEFTETLVTLVCVANDISAMAASELLFCFNIVSDRIPKLFTDPLEIVRWCRKWLRFEEMKLILGGNMETFRERWASGLGPIANSFSKEEASHLIRALFSNTSTRSALLLEISKYKN